MAFTFAKVQGPLANLGMKRLNEKIEEWEEEEVVVREKTICLEINYLGGPFTSSFVVYGSVFFV